MIDDTCIMSEFTKSLKEESTRIKGNDELFNVITDLYDINCEIDGVFDLIRQFQDDIKCCNMREFIFFFEQTKGNVNMHNSEIRADIVQISRMYSNNKIICDIINKSLNRLNETQQIIESYETK
jgi:hypothetical protein